MTITSGTGLISGLDIQSLVTSLMAIEAKPKDLLTARISKNTEKQKALMTLQAQVMAVQLAAANFNKETIFQQKGVTTSNESVMTATATKYAAEGTYRFVVKQLASSHSFISNGFSSLESGVGTGTISFEIGQGQVARDTDLSFLNGQNGVQNGKISITDRAGKTAEIDLTIAMTMRDVIDKINSNSTVNVTASVSGDHLVITDNNAAATGNLIIAEVGTGHTAADLGILANAAQSQIVGQDIVSVTTNTLLSDLNDGNGIRGLDSSLANDLIFNLGDGTSLNVDLKTTLSETIGPSGPTDTNTLQSLNGGAGIRAGTFRITDQNGRSVEINTGALVGDDNPTLGQLKTAIQDAATAAGMSISVAFGGLDHILITDNSTASSTSSDGKRASNFIIEDLNGGHAAADLGIVGNVAGKSINGDQIWRMETLGDVINAVNNHWNNNGDLTLSINADGTGLAVAQSVLGGVTVQADFGSFAADDLGLLTPDGFSGTQYEGRRLIAGLNTVMLRSLNGGSGGDTTSSEYGTNRITEAGTINIIDRDGHAATIDLSNAFTVQDVLDAINNAGTNISAGLNSVGNGIVLQDSSSGTGNMVIADTTGDIASKLGITTNSAVNSIDSGNLQLQYISEAISLDDMRQGQGITRGKFTITDGLGASATINLATNNINTLADVVDAINGKTGIRARINDSGDGLILEDTSTGSLIPISVTELGGSTASDLGLLASAQQAADGSYYIDGSYEFKMDLGGGDSIEDIISQINNAGIGLKASLINDGEKYHINFISEVSGRTGNVYLDAGATSLNTTTISEGRDAIILLGDGTSEHPLLISSSSNTIENAIKGTTLELVSASDTPVDITVSQDIDSIVTQLNSFVEAFNSTMKNLAEVTKFDGENYNHGILFADHTATSIKQTMVSLIQRVVAGVSSNYNRLSNVGIKLSSMGSETSTDASGKTTTYAVAGVTQLSFDEDVFRQAFADNPDAVAELFTTADTGVGDYIANKLKLLANTSESVMAARIDAISDNQKLLNDRIDALDVLLSAKETRLYNQFYAMEEALGNMQSQQQALTTLASLSSSWS
jgi:flagellar hook-associated protein 2